MECFICGIKGPTVKVSKRIETLRNASLQRNDGLNEKLPEGSLYFMSHINCVSTYCSKHHIQRVVSKRLQQPNNIPEPKRLRGASSFNFQQHCLFCGTDCDVERPKKNPSRWRESFLCRTSDRSGKTAFKQSIIRKADQRRDTWGADIAFRVNGALSDLHSADARYHKDCMSKFFSNKPANTGGVEDCDIALNELVREMRCNCDRIWNTVELYNLYKQYGGINLMRPSLIPKLQEILEPDLLVLSSPGVASIVGFKSKLAHQLRIVNDTEDDFSHCIARLAKKIRSECRNPDPDTYDTHISMDRIIHNCSETLLALLAEISPKLDATMPAAMIGNIVNSSVTGKTTSLQLSLSVLMDRQRLLIDHLHTYGITSSYNELRLFRMSAATASANEWFKLSQFSGGSGLVQVVADNFDAQIHSQNGQLSTHGLAMVITQHKKSHEEHGTVLSNSETIKRIKWSTGTSKQLSLGEVNVQRFHGSKSPAMPNQYGVRVIPTLQFLAHMQVSHNRASVEDMSFLLSVTSEDLCPEYGGFNTNNARERGVPAGKKTNVVYAPFLDMAPAEPGTMKTCMVEAQRLTALAGQEWTIFTNDQHLYRVAVHIKWVDEDLFSKFVPRLGGMHMLMSFVGTVGNLMADSGLEDILKSTFAGVPKLLSGKKFPQNVRALRLVVEELLRTTIADNSLPTTTDLINFLDVRSKLSNTTKLWVECLIKPVLIMMEFVRAEREGDWPLHMYAVEKMLPYFFASGHFNYARYGLYYFRSMQALDPEVSKKFMAGEHVMRHRDGLWNAVWSDMFIESSYMRYGHGPSGVIGNTLNETTVAIWALSLGTFCQIKNDLQSMKNGEVEKLVTCHAEERHTRVTADAIDRQSIRESLSTCVDVLDITNHPEKGVISIYSGLVVDDPGLNAQNSVSIGKKQLHAYEKGWPNGFHANLKRNVKAMAAFTKKKTRVGNSHHIVDTGFIYARIIGIMASSRETVSLQTVFSYELAPHPTALFDDDGNMRDPNKSALKSKLQVECEIRSRSRPYVIILDACAILWTVPWPSKPSKVLHYVDAVERNIKRRIKDIPVAHIVFDRYYELSTKSCCRSSRVKGFSRVFQLTEESPLPNKDIVLKVSANKEQVIKFIVNRLCLMQVPIGQKVIITGDDLTPIEVGIGRQQIPVTHEEADVTMAYHMIQEAAKGNSPITVVSDDTDVLCILAHHLYAQTGGLPHETELTMEGCSQGRSTINVNEVIKKHAAIMHNLLAGHALTGCDTVSSFSGIGKPTVLKKLSTYKDLINLGDPLVPINDVIASASKFISTLYGQKQDELPLDNMRAIMFQLKIGGKRLLCPKLNSLPLTTAGFQPHCQRAHYQTILWKSAGSPSPPPLNPLDYGWEKNGNMLQPVKIIQGQLQAPNEVLNLISCGCTTGCKSALCSCKKFSLPCTGFCVCKGTCFNPSSNSSDDDFVE